MSTQFLQNEKFHFSAVLHAVYEFGLQLCSVLALSFILFIRLNVIMNDKKKLTSIILYNA